ncbi:MAG TPA: T9SS type A sorting domain-containing protein [Chitinophagales bacterium]|nr:T9SS type A sorting domain-containing protein [Chitinophagales bacterium]
MNQQRIKPQFLDHFIWVYFVLLSFPFTSHAQTPCGTDVIHNFELQTNLEYRQKYIEQNEEIRSFIQNKENARIVDDQTVYTIPVVVHVIHLGEAEGSGSNISDFQITEAIRGLNERFRNIIGNGNDIQLEFCLAVRDPDGNLTTGINRVDGGAVENYQQYGIGGSCESISASFYEIKSLSYWPVLDYYNIWVVHKICGGWAGYAYYPNGLYYDGTIIRSNYMKYGEPTLAHEVGHGFNLPHTFNGDGGNASCPLNSDCTTQGDFICDTPPHKQKDCGSSNPCSSDGYWDNTRYNYMSYCGVSTANARFTIGQKERMRATLNFYPRANLLKSLGCVPSAENAITLLEISNPIGTICSANQLEPIIKVGNIGKVTVHSFIIQYTQNNGDDIKIKWTGSLLPNTDTTLVLPFLELVNGENTLNLKILLPNGQVDDLKYQQEQTVDFKLEPSACFTTVWKTSNFGVTENNQIYFPGYSDSEYNIYWEEVNDTSIHGIFQSNKYSTTFTFPQIGTYRVSIAPKENGLHRILFYRSEDKSKIIDVEQWGKIVWSSFQEAFSGCINLKVSALDAPNLSSVADMSYMFSNATSFNQSLGNWNLKEEVELDNMLSNSGLDCQNYNRTLIGWAHNALTPDNLNLEAQEIKYGAEGAEARNQLLSRGWTITDDGLDEDCESIITSISNRSKSDLLSVYPNPNQGSFTIEIFGENKNATLEIINVLGQKVFSQELKNLKGKQTISADLRNHGKGIYWINLYFNNEVINRRIVIQ